MDTNSSIKNWGAI